MIENFWSDEDTIRIRIENDHPDYWDWCRENLDIGTWRSKIPRFGYSATYLFNNPEDATLFKLKFNL